MADVTRRLHLRHLRGAPTSWVSHTAGGKVRAHRPPDPDAEHEAYYTAYMTWRKGLHGGCSYDHYAVTELEVQE